MTTSSQHIEQVVEELQRKRYDYMRWAITGEGDGNKIAQEMDTIVRTALASYAAIVEAETVERCAKAAENIFEPYPVEVFSSPPFGWKPELNKWCKEQGYAIDNISAYFARWQREVTSKDIAAAIRALQGKEEKV